MHFIEDDRRRKATFMKRMPVIKKKAMELSKLCGIKVLLICNGNSSPGDVINNETWPETQSEVFRIIQHYSTMCPVDRDRRKLNQKTHIQTQMKKMSVEIERLRKSNIDGEYDMFRNSLVSIRALEDKLETVKARINEIMNDQAIVHGDDTDLLSLCFDPQAEDYSNNLDSIIGTNYCTSDHHGMHQNYDGSMMEESHDHLIIDTPPAVAVEAALMVDCANINLRNNSLLENNSLKLQNEYYTNHSQFNSDIMVRQVRNNIPPPLSLPLPHVFSDHLKTRSNWNIGDYSADCPFQSPWQYQYQHLLGSTSDQIPYVDGKHGFITKMW